MGPMRGPLVSADPPQTRGELSSEGQAYVTPHIERVEGSQTEVAEGSRTISPSGTSYVGKDPRGPRRRPQVDNGPVQRETGSLTQSGSECSVSQPPPDRHRSGYRLQTPSTDMWRLDSRPTGTSQRGNSFRVPETPADLGLVVGTRPEVHLCGVPGSSTRGRSTQGTVRSLVD